MKLDYLTLFAIMGFIDVIIVIILLYYITIVRSRKWFITLYLVYKIFETTALVMLGLRNIISDFISIQIANSIYFISVFIHLVSVNSYRGKLDKKFTYGLGIITILSIILFLVFSSNSPMRVVIGSLGVTTLFSIGAIHLYKTRRPYKLPLLLASGFIGYAAANFCRGIFVLSSSDTYQFYDLATWDLITVIAGIATILISSFGFLLLLKEVDDKIIFKQNRLTSIAFDESPVSIVLTDKSGNIEFVNPKFSDLTGYTEEEAKGKNTQILKTSLTPEETYQSLWKTIKSGNTWHGEFVNKKKNGDLYFEEAVIAPIKNEKQEITNYLAIKIDITQRKANEEVIQLRNQELSEINHTKDRLFSIIGHDLKGPIGNLRQLLELINHDIEKGDKKSVQKILDMSKETAKTSFDLLDNLLNWSRSQIGVLKAEPETFSLSALAQEVSQLYQALLEQKKIELLYDFEESNEVYADKEMISTVIRNLLSNAIKFTPIYGKIGVKINTKKDEIILSVTDSGIGIEEDRLKKIFNFVENQSTRGTSGEKGTGLGLVLSKEFILKNKGDIWAESIPEKGTSFFISLPIKA